MTATISAPMPAQNATNWLKIVQRVPVRIAFNGDMIKTRPLPLGTSLAVTVDTSDRSWRAVGKRRQ
jgi:membrane fusion protein (multidrug efflux system)